MSKTYFSITKLKKFIGPFHPGRRGENLPEAYQKFYREWKVQSKEPVHYILEQGKWKRNPETGEVIRVQNVPIPLKFPKESNQQLWGGEGIIQGFQKRKSFRRRVPHFWMPTVKRTVVYSEILNEYMSVVVTERTMSLIHQNYGFDHYILKTAACDLQSELAVKLKRKMLLTLLNKDLKFKEPERCEDIYNKYKHYLSNYTPEEIEWYGLTIDEAQTKLKLAKQEEEAQKIKPLKHQYRLDLISELLEKGINAEPLPDKQQSWLTKLNPFQNKTS